MNDMTQSYHIQIANPTGGKAGKGKNKTSTVQVIDDTDTDNAFLVHSFRFKVGDMESRIRAFDKAEKWVAAALAGGFHLPKTKED